MRKESIRLTASQLTVDGKPVLKGLTAKLGTGAFTYAYKVSKLNRVVSEYSTCTVNPLDDKVVLLASCCPIKELYSLGWLPEGFDLVPEGDEKTQVALCQQVAFPYCEEMCCFDDGNYRLYAMPVYEKFSKATVRPKQWEFYRLLRSLLDTCKTNKVQDIITLIRKGGPLVDWMSSSFNEGLEDWLCDALGVTLNYGDDIRMEVSPRNLAVDEYGRLILLDVFYSYNRLQKVRTY